MSLIFFKISAAIFIFLISFLAGYKPLYAARLQPERRFFELGEALAAGIFLGIALFHMLPKATEDFAEVLGRDTYPYANLICALGFVVLLFLEKVILRLAYKRQTANYTTVPYVLPIVLSLHALIEGTALGINTAIASTVLIFIAIIVHKGSESFALATSLGRSHIAMTRAVPIFFFWALMSPFGVLCGAELARHLQTREGLLMAALFNAFAAGTFLYIATLHKTAHVGVSHKDHYLPEVLLLVLGLTLMAVVEIWV